MDLFPARPQNYNATVQGRILNLLICLQVIRLPLLRKKARKCLWEKGNKKLQVLGVDTIHQLDETLEGYLQHVGKFFGKNTSYWERVGEIWDDIFSTGYLVVCKLIIGLETAA